MNGPIELTGFCICSRIVVHFSSILVYRTCGDFLISPTRLVALPENGFASYLRRGTPPRPLTTGWQNGDIQEPARRYTMYDQTNVNQTCLRTSKRRKGFPSETHVRRGLRIVHTDRTIGKLGRYDPCSFGSERRFEKVFLEDRFL